MYMRTPQLALAQLLLLSTVVAATGCGSDGKLTSTIDAGLDGRLDVPDADTTKADHVAAPDTSKSDTAPSMDTLPVDTSPIDAPGKADGATPDLPMASDVGLDQASLDSNPVDVWAGMDASGLDSGLASEAGGELDGLTVDSLETSTATITFRLRNTGAQKVYLHSDCWIRVEVTSEADATAYSNASFCACGCADPLCTSAVACSPCAPADGVAVEAGNVHELPWVARKSTMESKIGLFGSFACVSHAPIPTGAYRVEVQVYPTQADAAASTNGRTVQRTFVLSPADAAVDLSI
jgi:hypothetical protein